MKKRKLRIPEDSTDHGYQLNHVKFSAFILAVVCGATMLASCAGLLLVYPRHQQDIKSMRSFKTDREGIIPASRGRILDRNHEPVAENRIVARLFVNPSRVDPDLRYPLIQALMEHFTLDEGAIADNLTDPSCRFRILCEDLPSEQENWFYDHRWDPFYNDILQEVGILYEEERVYPNGEFAGPVIGYTGDNSKGLGGMELKLDLVMAGRPGLYTDVRDQRGNRVPGTRHVEVEERNGTDIVLTLDNEIQKIAWYALYDGILDTGAKGGAVIVTDPRTGDIRAMVSLPAYEPSHYQDYLDDEYSMFNRPACLSYEAGSVMKVFTFAAGLEEEVISEDQNFHVGHGRLYFGNYSVPDHTYSYDPDVSLRDSVVHSCNRAAALTSTWLGRDTITDWFHRFGFGVKTDIAFPGEPSGNLKESLTFFSRIDLANMGFGHGITCSPLQLVQGFSAFANDGYIVPLRLVDARIDPEAGTEITMPYCDPQQVLSHDVAELMNRFMVETVEDGTATQARTQWTSAGKTGTAQKLDDTGHYAANRFYATFVGYGPVPDPRWLILVVLDEPQRPNHFAGTASGPVYKAIFSALMLKYGDDNSVREIVIPEEEVSVNESVIDDDIDGTKMIGDDEIVYSPDPFNDGVDGE
ncbi:MAG TPA: penicillin-binding protein 2 [bacterium]|jgi:cell division protein FtsI (penicillin-binding protein 3)/stage V sporulation protein D (sporulation-specific penicillin-binding protein)